jgi:hypothetical protein
MGNFWWLVTRLFASEKLYIKKNNNDRKRLDQRFFETTNQFHQDCALNFIDDDEFDPVAPTK